MSQTSVNQLNNDYTSKTSKVLNSPSEESYNLSIKGQGKLKLGKILYYQVQGKKEGWGLFKELQVEEEDIEQAKKSLFPERDF